MSDAVRSYHRTRFGRTVFLGRGRLVADLGSDARAELRARRLFHGRCVCRLDGEHRPAVRLAVAVVVYLARRRDRGRRRVRDADRGVLIRPLYAAPSGKFW